MQIIPLDLTILYSNYSYPNKYWTAQRNTTEWNVYMRELARAGNQITQLELQALTPSLPEAHIGKSIYSHSSKTAHSEVTQIQLRLTRMDSLRTSITTPATTSTALRPSMSPGASTRACTR